MTTINFATTAPQFTNEDNNRRLFKTSAEKLAWEKTIFTDSPKTLVNFDLTDMTNGYIRVSFDDLEKGRKVQYLNIKISDKTYYFFVDSVTVVRGDTEGKEYLLQFNFTLDTITTYLDEVLFKGSTKVKRTHWNRFAKDDQGNRQFDFNQHSAIWNNEPDISAIPTVKKPLLDFNFTNKADEVGVLDYISKFNIGGVAAMAYATFTPKITDGAPSYGTGRAMPYPGLIVPVFGHITGEPYFDYYGKRFKAENTYNSDLAESSVLDAVHLVNLPITKHWEKPADGSQWFGFKNIVNNANETWAITHALAEYDLNVENPLKWIPTIFNRFDPDNEPKLKSSQFTHVNILSYTGEKSLLVNEFLDIAEDKLYFGFKEDVLSTETVAHFDVKSYKRDYTTFDNWKIDFINRDELPTMSSAYTNFVQGHSNAFKTGIETNRMNALIGAGTSVINGGIGATSSIAKAHDLGFATSIVQGGMGAITSIYAGLRQEKMYKSQIKDLKNSGDTAKAINGSVISNWDNLAYKIFGNSAINFGLEIKVLSDVDKYNVAMHLNKFGYETERVFHLKNISELKRRSRFTYWECVDFHNNVVKGSVPKEVLDDLSMAFRNGLRLWEVGTEINNYELENWEL